MKKKQEKNNGNPHRKRKRTAPRETPFYVLMKTLENQKVKEVKISDGKIMIVFDNKFDSALVFSKKGKFLEFMPATSMYMA